MRSITSSGEGLSITDNVNESNCDSNPYAYPYFHAKGTSPLVYDLVLKFASLWNEVAAGSDSVRGHLKHLVKMIQFRCYAQPMEASWADSCGDTALHRLCQISRFPSTSNVAILSLTSLLLDVADALIDAYPGSATIACNHWRETPLHQFVSHCGFPNHLSDVETFLVASLPENPMFDLLKRLSRDNACAIRNCWGSLPLHDACELSGWEIETQSPSNSLLTWMTEQHVLMVDWLLCHNPDAVSSTDHSDQTPLHRAFTSLKCNTVVVEKLLSCLDDSRGAQSTLWNHYELPHNRIAFSSNDTQSAVRTLGVLWDMTVAVLLKEGDGKRLVHAAVSMKDCPFCVMELAMQLYPEQLVEIDHDGYTPLILAMNNGLEGIVNVVLGANPSAASIPNAQGRLPLVLAAASHYSWEPTIKSLFVAEPRAVSSRDPTTLLFPFAVAAVNETREETDQLSTIYELLRVDPSVLILH